MIVIVSVLMNSVIDVISVLLCIVFVFIVLCYKVGCVWFVMILNFLMFVIGFFIVFVGFDVKVIVMVILVILCLDWCW